MTRKQVQSETLPSETLPMCASQDLCKGIILIIIGSGSRRFFLNLFRLQKSGYVYVISLHWGKEHEKTYF